MAPPVMPNRTDTAIESESLRTRNWVLAGVVAGLLLFVQGIMTFVMTNAASKMDVYSKSLSEVLTAVQVMNARNEALTQRVANLEAKEKDQEAHDLNTDVRLRSVEQRAAIHDEYMTSHK